MIYKMKIKSIEINAYLNTIKIQKKKIKEKPAKHQKISLNFMLKTFF